MMTFVSCYESFESLLFLYCEIENGQRSPTLLLVIKKVVRQQVTTRRPFVDTFLIQKEINLINLAISTRGFRYKD